MFVLPPLLNLPDLRLGISETLSLINMYAIRGDCITKVATISENSNTVGHFSCELYFAVREKLNTYPPFQPLVALMRLFR